MARPHHPDITPTPLGTVAGEIVADFRVAMSHHSLLANAVKILFSRLHKIPDRVLAESCTPELWKLIKRRAQWYSKSSTFDARRRGDPTRQFAYFLHGILYWERHGQGFSYAEWVSAKLEWVRTGRVNPAQAAGQGPIPYETVFGLPPLALPEWLSTKIEWVRNKKRDAAQEVDRGSGPHAAAIGSPSLGGEGRPGSSAPAGAEGRGTPMEE